MISKKEFVEFHQEIDNLTFRVSDSKRKTDEDVFSFIKKHYQIDNPKIIAEFSKTDRDKILAELKMSELFIFERLRFFCNINDSIKIK